MYKFSSTYTDRTPYVGPSSRWVACPSSITLATQQPICFVGFGGNLYEAILGVTLQERTGENNSIDSASLPGNIDRHVYASTHWRRLRSALQLEKKTAGRTYSAIESFSHLLHQTMAIARNGRHEARLYRLNLILERSVTIFRSFMFAC